MFGIIYIIVIGYVIFKIVRRKEEENAREKGTGAGMQTNNAPVRKVPFHTNHGTNKQTPQTQQKQVKPSIQAQQGGSTMAYLEEKARQDALEHEREKREEARRLHQNYGGFRAAERLYEGDSVPDGKKCVVCGYCGAENLLPMMPREHYSCYFCREQIN